MKETKQLKMIEHTSQAQSEMRALLLHLRPISLESKSLKSGIEVVVPSNYNESTNEDSLGYRRRETSLNMPKTISSELPKSFYRIHCVIHTHHL